MEMNCETIIEDLQAYLDGELPEARRNEITEHIKECAECAKTVSDLKNVSEAMQGWQAPEPKMPTGQQLLQMARPPEGRLLRFTRGIYQLPFKVKAPVIATAALVVIGLFVTGQLGIGRSSYAPMDGASAPSDYYQTRSSAETRPEAKNYNMPAAEPPAPMQPAVAPSKPSAALDEAERDERRQKIAGIEGGAASGLVGAVGDKKVPASPQRIAAETKEEDALKDASYVAELPKEKVSVDSRDRFIIYTAQLDIDTENFDDAKNKTSELAAAQGGFVTRLQVYSQSMSRSAQIVLRVPVKNFNQTIAEIRKFGKSTMESIEGQDVTDQYLEVGDELEIDKSLEKESREIIKNSPTDLNARREHEEIMRRIVRFRRQLQQMRDGVFLSTITLNLREKSSESIIGATEGPSVGNQMMRALRGGVRDLFDVILPMVLFFIAAAPFVIFFGGIIYLFYFLGKRYLRKRTVYKTPTEMPDWMKASESPRN
jgi:anti-sigma factor RsiW